MRCLIHRPIRRRPTNSPRDHRTLRKESLLKRQIMPHRQHAPPRTEHRGVRLADIAPELCRPTRVWAQESSTIEDKWSTGTETRFFARDLPPRTEHPHLRLVEESADLPPEEVDEALSLRSDSDTMSRKRVLFDIMTRVFARNDTMSFILTICQPYLIGETGCHSTDSASSVSPPEELDTVDHSADLKPRSTTRTLACTSHSQPSILKPGGEEMLVTIGVGVLCGMLGLVVGRELTLKSSQGEGQ